MIKASALAGAAAWTAPVIIDSLASPAAAVSYALQTVFREAGTTERRGEPQLPRFRHRADRHGGAPRFP